jgi:fructose-1,6-bisphosphatase II
MRSRLCYMEKIVVGPYARGAIDIDRSIAENLRKIAFAANRAPSELTVAMLDRDRNVHVLDGVREVGARVRLFGDGDVVNALLALLDDRPEVDVLMGIGGAPEGVVTACAVKALGGDMCGRFWLRGDNGDLDSAEREGVDLTAPISLDQLCSADDSFFVATGVTGGDLLSGVERRGGSVRLQSLVISRGRMRAVETRLDPLRIPQRALQCA